MTGATKIVIKYDNIVFFLIEILSEIVSYFLLFMSTLAEKRKH